MDPKFFPGSVIAFWNSSRVREYIEDCRARELKRLPPPGRVEVDRPLVLVKVFDGIDATTEGRACDCCGLRGWDPISSCQAGWL